MQLGAEHINTTPCMQCTLAALSLLRAGHEQAIGARLFVTLLFQQDLMVIFGDSELHH